MKKIKLSTIIIVTSILAITTIQSCKKYEEGPRFSLRSKTERVSNIWSVENYKVAGSDLTSLVSGYTETFTNNGTYSYSWLIANGAGTWAFQNDNAEIKLSGNDDQSSRTLYILKLEEKSFWYYYMVGDDKHELHLTSK